jgi:large subunit ribosomal protein L10
MKREDKQIKAQELSEKLRKARTVVLSGFEGLTVAQDTDLRRKLSATGARYEVVKNSLIERAAQGTPVEPVARKLKGTTSLAYTETDPVALAKVLTEYAKEYPALVFRAGVVEGRVVSMPEFQQIASLPSRDELLAKVLFLIHSPAQRLATAVSGAARQLARVVEQGVKERKFKEASGS